MNKEQRFSEKQALGIKTQGSLGVFRRNATSFTLKDHRFPFLQRPKLPLDSVNRCFVRVRQQMLI